MDVALKTFEVNNNVQTIDPTDALFTYSREDEQVLEDQQPWRTNPEYFHTVKISVIALIKMVTHARSGGIHEIMGIMYGKIRDGTFWIMDAAPLPVQGTETRVNAGNEAMEYMVQFDDAHHQVGKAEVQRGWYHSHPGYGCWLSGVDVTTQSTNQQFQDPYLAVVIDPNRTVSAGKVEIGAFRTYPEGHKASTSSQYQSIPLDKIEDFGVHAGSYYSIKVEIYKTRLDEQLLNLLWNKYWIATLSQSLVLNRSYASAQLSDLHHKISAAAVDIPVKLKKTDAGGLEDEPTPLNKVVQDSTRITTELQNGMTAQILKERLFNAPGDATRAAAGHF